MGIASVIIFFLATAVHIFERSNHGEKDSLTAPSVFLRYTDEKISQIMSSRYVSRSVSQLEFAP